MKDNIKNIVNVIRARFIISLKIYFRYPLKIVMNLISPLIWITPFYFMGKVFSVNGRLKGFEKYVGNSNFIGYIVVGYIISSYVTTIMWSLGFSLKEEMQQGVLESNWSTPVNRILLLISKSLFYIFMTTIEVIIACIICKMFFGFKITGEIYKALLFIIPGLIGLMGLGLGVAALVLEAKNANPIIDLTSALLQAICGGFFPIKVMYKGMIFIAMCIPLTYVYDGTRAILINQKPLINIKLQFILIIIFMFVFMMLGCYIFNRVEKKCREKGILGTH